MITYIPIFNENVFSVLKINNYLNLMQVISTILILQLLTLKILKDQNYLRYTKMMIIAQLSNVAIFYSKSDF